WVAGRGEKGMLLAAQFGNGWLPGGFAPEEYPARIEALEELAATKFGRTDVNYTIAMEVRACVDKTTEEARRQAYATEVAGVRASTPYGSSEQVYKRAWGGSTEAIRERVARYVGGGVRHFELKPIYHNVNHLLEQLQMWAEDVTPAFR